MLDNRRCHALKTDLMELYRDDSPSGCCEALHAIRGREGCSLNRVLKCFDTIALLIVLVLQGSTLNYFLIDRMEGNGNGWYFWFLADFAIVIIMMTAVFLARRYYTHCRQQAELTATPTPTTESSCGWLGLLPGSYVSWFLYSSLLTAKVVLLIQMDIAKNIPSEAWYGSQFLTLVIGCSALVFSLLVDSHHEAPTDSKQQNYVLFIMAYASLEILDSVAFLSLLFPNQCNQPYRVDVENSILILTSAAFILPTFAIYKLSLSNFGMSTRPLGLKLVYRLVNLLVINMPYLVIRVYLWTYLNVDVSVFLLKNVILCYVHARWFIPEFREWICNLRNLRKSLLTDERSFDGVPNSADSMVRQQQQQQHQEQSSLNTTIELDEQHKDKPV